MDFRLWNLTELFYIYSNILYINICIMSTSKESSPLMFTNKKKFIYIATHFKSVYRYLDRTIKNLAVATISLQTTNAGIAST